MPLLETLVQSLAQHDKQKARRSERLGNFDILTSAQVNDQEIKKLAECSYRVRVSSVNILHDLWEQ